MPRPIVEQAEIALRGDSLGPPRDLLDACRDAGIALSVGFDLTEPVRQAIIALNEQTWRLSGPGRRALGTEVVRDLVEL